MGLVPRGAVMNNRPKYNYVGFMYSIKALFEAKDSEELTGYASEWPAPDPLTLTLETAWREAQ